MRTNNFALLAGGLLILASLAGCRGPLAPAPLQTPTLTPTAGPSPTPTPVAFGRKDLSKIVLQASDLPGGYTLVNQLSKPDDLEQVFGDNLTVHTGLVAGQDAAYAIGSHTSSTEQVFDSAIFVFSDEGEARQAYQALSQSFAGAKLDFPELGTESVALHSETSVIGDPNAVAYTVAVVWRQDSAVILLDTIGAQVPTQQMVQLAQTIQGRILQK